MDERRPTIEDLLELIEEQRRKTDRQKRELESLRRATHPRARPKRYLLRKATIPAVSALTALSMSSSAYASIPDSSGVLHGCYATYGTEHPLFLLDTAVVPACP